MSQTAAERAALGKELLAVINGGNPDHETVRRLIDAGAALEETDGDVQNRTPLLAACSTSGCEDAARLLLQAGAYIEARDQNGATPLMMAVLMKNEEMVDLLIMHKAALDDTGFKNMTPLMWAANLNVRGIVQKLIDAGADGDIVSSKGFKAADYADNNGKTHLANEIEERLKIRKTARADFAAALAAGMPLEKDVTPLRLPTVKRRPARPQGPR
ncbi:MAG: ankyrin repeat domain-containing protein [Alphaproteobacteria bacterium]|nr:ankyrin repeat domain-containing protein [Alphaproteobacteria bacterium]